MLKKPQTNELKTQIDYSVPSYEPGKEEGLSIMVEIIRLVSGFPKTPNIIHTNTQTLNRRTSKLLSEVSDVWEV